MIIPYSRFLERRAERDSAAAEVRRRDAQRTVDIEAIAAVGPVGPESSAGEHTGQAASREQGQS